MIRMRRNSLERAIAECRMRNADFKIRQPLPSNPQSVIVNLKSLGVFSATMLVIGNTIGVGIFTTSGVVAAAVPSPGWLLIVWALGGLLALAGALTWAELGTTFPHAGG